METNEIVSALHGTGQESPKPEGGDVITPLSGHHVSKPFAEEAPQYPNALQGAGGGSSLTPGAQGAAADGSPVKGWKGAAYEGAAGEPHQAGGTSLSAGALPPSSLTPSGSGGRPEGGADGQAVVPAGTDPNAAILGPDGTGQGLQPGLRPAKQAGWLEAGKDMTWPRRS